MAVDVLTEIEIDAPVSAVADVAGDPSRAPEWYERIESVDWQTEPPVELGSKMTFVARFLGRRLEYTYEVVEFEDERRLVMTTAQGPFPMTTTYTWEPSDGGGTHMTLRNAGRPAGFSRFVAPIMTPAIRRQNNKDLKALKSLLEG